MSEIQDPIEDLVRSMLKELGEDPGRDGLVRTPQRMAAALRFLTAGYDLDPDKLVNGALFEVHYDQMVLVKDIDFYSLCEHHVLPFFGKVHVGYIPDKKVLGLSKVPRIVDMLARRLQVQERMTVQIARTLEDVLEPKGVGVVVRAEHLCMRMRGVEKPNSTVVTSALLGAFQKRDTRQEFMNLIANGS